MKMALPSKKDVTYIKRKLKIWFVVNQNQNDYPNLEYKEFRRAVIRLCEFFNVSIPEIKFFERFSGVIVGQCTNNGEIQLLIPLKYPVFKKWCNVFFHEFGHYIYYANAEKKANEFARRMMDRW